MSDDELINFCYTMYTYFGMFTVINFIKGVQHHGHLNKVDWETCDSCEYFNPFLGDICLVCGSH